MSAQEARLARAHLAKTSPSSPRYPELLRLIDMLKLMLETYGEYEKPHSPVGCVEPSCGSTRKVEGCRILQGLRTGCRDALSGANFCCAIHRTLGAGS
jgi:hypothetical protein